MFSDIISKIRKKKDEVTQKFRPVTQAVQQVRNDFQFNPRPGGFVGFTGPTAQSLKSAAPVMQKVGRDTIKPFKQAADWQMKQSAQDPSMYGMMGRVGAGVVNNALIQPATKSARNFSDFANPRKTPVALSKQGMTSYGKGLGNAALPMMNSIALPKTTAQYLAGSAALSGGFNAALGDKSKTVPQRMEQGVTQGLSVAPTLRFIGAGTNPAINKTVDFLAKTPIAQKALVKIASTDKGKAIARFIADRTATGALNVPEGMLMQKAIAPDSKYGAADAGLDFLMGAAGGRQVMGKGMAKGANKTIDPRTLEELDGLRDYLNRAIKSKDGKAVDAVSKDIDRIAERYLDKKDIDLISAKSLDKSPTVYARNLMDAIANKVGEYNSRYDGFQLGFAKSMKDGGAPAQQPKIKIALSQETPKTVKAWIKSKFSDRGHYADLPVIRKEENITLYQGGSDGKRQFWTPDKKYASQFGEVTEKTGAFYKVDNGNTMTDVYVEAPKKSQQPKIKVKPAQDTIQQPNQKLVNIQNPDGTLRQVPEAQVKPQDVVVETLDKKPPKIKIKAPMPHIGKKIFTDMWDGKAYELEDFNGAGDYRARDISGQEKFSTIYSKEQVEELLKNQDKFKANLDYISKQKAQDQIDEKNAEIVKNKKEYLYGFMDDVDAMRRGKAKSALLNTGVKTEDGRVLSRAKYMEELISKGWTPHPTEDGFIPPKSHPNYQFYVKDTSAYNPIGNKTMREYGRYLHNKGFGEGKVRNPFEAQEQVIKKQELEKRQLEKKNIDPIKEQIDFIENLKRYEERQGTLNPEKLEVMEQRLQELKSQQQKIKIKAPVLNQSAQIPTDYSNPDALYRSQFGAEPPIKPPTPPQQPQVKDSINPDEYIRQQAQKQVDAYGEPSLFGKVKDLAKQVKNKFVDGSAPIEDLLVKAQKEGSYQIMPEDNIRYQIDKVLRSDALATQFAKDNGLEKVIKEVGDYDGFNQYLIAKRNIELAQKRPDIKTGRDITADMQLVQAKQAEFEPHVQAVRSYSQKLLDYKVQTGLVSKELSDALKAEYPDYVPLNRVFSFLEQQSEGVKRGKAKGSGVASIGTQRVLERLKGSEREIDNPLESLLEATGVALKQGETNKAASMLASYKDLPNNPFGLRELEKGETIGVKNTISFFDNGVKRTFETFPEIASAAKSLNQEQMNIITRILSVPTRVLQMGATGLNVPFLVKNIARDQLTAFINSNKPLSTSLVNPANFVRGLFSALKHDELYAEWVRAGAGGTSFDLARDKRKLTVAGIRSNRSAGSKVKYLVTNPSQMVRALEDVIGLSEEVTRVQQYKGALDAYVKQGVPLERAKILAGEESRMNTANFARRGEWGRALNAAIPFFNAGIQGARSFVRAAQANPAQMGAKLTASLFIPTAIATAYNLSDPERKMAYDDIDEMEKENNLIFILDPKPDKDGRYSAIKIPLPIGIGGLAGPVRRTLEGVDQMNPEGLRQIAKELTGSVTPINPLEEPSKIFSSITPQLLKPGLETLTNTNLFFGNDIVPYYMKNLPPEEQVKDNTSATARLIGGMTNTSPLIVQNAVRTGGAGLGEQLLNAADTGLVKAGMAPESQISGRSIPEQISQSFASARGGQQERNVYDQMKKIGTGGNADTAKTSGKVSNQQFLAYAKVHKFDEYLGENTRTGLEKHMFEKDKVTMARKIFGNEEIPDEIKNQAYEKMGIKREDVEYDHFAHADSIAKAGFIIESMQGKGYNDVLQYLYDGRRESISGYQVANNKTLDLLVDEGVISEADAKALKKVKLTSVNGNNIKVSSGKSGKAKAAKKIPIAKGFKPNVSKIDVASAVRPVKIQMGSSKRRGSTSARNIQKRIKLLQKVSKPVTINQGR